MKETVSSLRAYLLVSGVLTVLLTLSAVGQVVGQPGLAELPLQYKLVLWVPVIVRLGLGVGFVAAGAQLRQTLPTGAVWIKQLLVVSVVLNVLMFALIVGVLGIDVGRGGLIFALVGLAITLYLYANIKRLAAEQLAPAHA